MRYNKPMRDPNLVLKNLKDRVLLLGDNVVFVCNFLLNDPKLPLWSGSSLSYQHHYGKGGLINHLYEVVELCFLNRSLFLDYQIDENELFMAALFHDAGKLYDYEPMDFTHEKWTSTNHKRYIHHISRSATMWTQAVCALNNPEFYDKYHEKVLHAILAHHGSRDKGSPVAPKSRVAWLVHLCDGISARMYDAESWDIIKRGNS